MSACRVPFRIGLPLLGLATALLLAACGSSVSTPNPPTGPGTAAGAIDPLGTIAYVNTNGCIARVAPSSGQPIAAPYCPASRKGATSVTWIDADSAAYATDEARALGWQLVHFSTGVSEVMPVAEAPRVFLIPPQYYSPRGERLSIDGEGVVSLAADQGDIRIFPPPGKQPDNSTRLVAWSPDGDWVLLSTSTDKQLWIVGRTGESPRMMASASKGVAAWFMPSVGATPHADLTCSVTTSQSFGCVTPLRMPLEGSTFSAVNSTIDFSWSSCPGATGYELLIYATDPSQPLLTTLVVGTFSHQSAASFPAGELHWQVRAHIGTFPAPWSQARTFTVQ